MNRQFQQTLRSVALTVAITILTAFVAASTAVAAPICITNNQRIAFLGDSITQFGWGDPKGYVHLVADCLGVNGVVVSVIPAGVSGNTSKDMLARLDSDVLSKKPDWMTLSCGVNDVWHGDHGVAFGPYMDNITKIVDKAQAAHINVIVLSATAIGEDLGNDNNKKLAYYNAFLKYLAQQRGLIFADLNQAEVTSLAAKTGSANYLTKDGVHMNDLGNRMMARAILSAMGVPEDQIAKTILPMPLPVPGAVAVNPPASTAVASAVPAVAPASTANIADLALNEPFVCSDPNQSGWNGLTDGTWGKVAPACFATGKMDTFPKSVTIDLQQPQSIASIVTGTVAKAATKTVEFSISLSPGADFKTVGNHVFGQDQDEKYTCSFPSTQARYVRLTFPDHYPNGLYSPLHILLQEVEVYAPGKGPSS